MPEELPEDVVLKILTYEPKVALNPDGITANDFLKMIDDPELGPILQRYYGAPDYKDSIQRLYRFLIGNPTIWTMHTDIEKSTPQNRIPGVSHKTLKRIKGCIEYLLYRYKYVEVRDLKKLCEEHRITSRSGTITNVLYKFKDLKFLQKKGNRYMLP